MKFVCLSAFLSIRLFVLLVCSVQSSEFSFFVFLVIFSDVYLLLIFFHGLVS